MAIITPGKPVAFGPNVTTKDGAPVSRIAPATQTQLLPIPGFTGSNQNPIIPNIGINSGGASTLDQFMQNFQSYAPTLGQAPQITNQVLGANLEKLPGPIQNMDPAYYDTRFQQGADRLAAQFYGPGGTKDQTLDEIAKRGFIGSEAEQAILGQRVDTPYGQGITDLNRELLAQQIQGDYQTQQFNTDTQLKSLDLYGQLKKTDSANSLERDAAQAEIAAKYMDLGARLFSEQADITSREKVAQWEAELKAWESANEMWLNQQKLSEEARQFDTQTLITLIQTPGITATEASVANEELRRRGIYGEAAQGSSTLDQAAQTTNAPSTLEDSRVPRDIPRSSGAIYTDPVTNVKYRAFEAGRNYNNNVAGGKPIYIWARV